MNQDIPNKKRKDFQDQKGIIINTKWFKHNFLDDPMKDTPIKIETEIFYDRKQCNMYWNESAEALYQTMKNNEEIKALPGDGLVNLLEEK